MPVHPLTTALLVAASFHADTTRHELRYEQPAEHFEETLLLGNGRVGASVFGGVGTERIYLNDATLWTGGPVNPRMNPEAFEHLPAVREALDAGDWRGADSLVRQLQGSFSQSYAPLGTLFLDMDHGPDGGEVEDYVRTLDLASATATIEYGAGGVRYRRQAFVSHPDRIMAVRLVASEPGTLEFQVRFESLLRYQVDAEGRRLSVRGEAPVHAEPSYRGDVPDAIVYEDGRGTRFAVLVRIADTDGTVIASGDVLALENASYATLLVSVATSFNGFDREPGTDGLDEVAIAREQLSRAADHDFETLRERHTADFSSFFDRVALDLGPDPVPGLATDERLRRYTDGAADPYLESLYFQFGRYLLDQQLPHAPGARQPAGDLEPAPASSVEQQLHHEHQRRDELLAGRGDQPVRDARAASRIHREPGGDRERFRGDVLGHSRVGGQPQQRHMGDVEPGRRLRGGAPGVG